MPNTRIEAVLHAIGDGARLEQLVSDLLVREGYEVDPTGTRGPDAGRDSLLSRSGEQGILHCSVSGQWESKAHEDASSADERPEDFGFFIFATTQNPAGVKRDRVEEEISEEYGWRVQILDLERIRNRLQGNIENHDLIREHLNIDPNHAFDNPSDDAEEFYRDRIEHLLDREGYYGKIAEEHSLYDNDDLPILAVHMIPAETFGSDHNRAGSDLPPPPGFGRKGHTENFGDFVLNADSKALYDDEPFHHYSCFHEDGWAEAITVNNVPKTGEGELSTTIDKDGVQFVEDALEWYQDVGIAPPFRTFLTLLNAGEHTIRVPDNVWGPDHLREIGTDEFRFGDIVIEQFNPDVPEILRKPLYRLWNRTGWSTSLNYEESENENGETEYGWNP